MVSRASVGSEVSVEREGEQEVGSWLHRGGGSRKLWLPKDGAPCVRYLLPQTMCGDGTGVQCSCPQATVS